MSETKTAVTVKATASSDDHAVKVDFDAGPWFESADEEIILRLARDGWGGYASDDVAIFCEDYDQDLAAMFIHIDSVHLDAVRAGDSEKDVYGFSCAIDQSSALDWIDKNRPGLKKKVMKIIERG